MKELLQKMIVSLRKQVEEKVPEAGAFPVVYEREDVSAMMVGLSHLILKVSHVALPGSEDERFLELGAVNYPSPYGAETVVGYGKTKDILARLQDDTLLDVLIEKVPKLADDVSYEERHPWG